MKVAFVLLAALVASLAACGSLGQTAKSSASATCASSCKNLPVDSQSDCIASCTK